MHYSMYLIHSCSLVICFLWWWYLPVDWTFTVALLFKQNSSLNILCRTVRSSMWEVFAVHSWYLCSVAVSACKDSCWKMEHYIYSGSIEYWLTYITHWIVWFLDISVIYYSQNNITYYKQKLDVLPSLHSQTYIQFQGYSYGICNG